MKEEFDKLLSLFSQAYSGKEANLEEVLKETLSLFEKLKTSLKDSSPEEKQELMQSMSQMYAQLMEQTKGFAEKFGVTEEQLLAAAENPQNFSPEQWMALQGAKNRVSESSQDFKKSLRASPQEGEKKYHKPHKDNWIRS